MIFAIKMLGILAVLIAVTEIIYLKIKEKKKSLLFITDFISCVKNIEDLIGVEAIPIREILKKTQETAKESKAFFENVEKYINKEENPTLMQAWQECALKLTDNGIKHDVVSVIKGIGTHLGKMSIEIETENLKLVRRELIKIKERMQEECVKECKLIKSLGMAICGFIILIFI